MKIIDFLKAGSEKLVLPENYYHGWCLPDNFALPDSILMFFARWGVSDEQVHGRYQLVIPFAPVIYFVENSRYELQRGLGLLLSPWQKHNHMPDSEKVLCERLIITFELPTAQDYLPGDQLVELSDTAMEYAAEMLTLYRQHQMPELSWQLVKLLKELSGRMSSNYEKKISEATSRSLSIISKNIGSALDIQFIADELQLSASYLRMIFRKDMGISIGRYIAEQRGILACCQLLDTDLSIQQISENSELEKIYANSHFLKNKIDKSPQEFRMSGTKPSSREVLL